MKQGIFFAAILLLLSGCAGTTDGTGEVGTLQSIAAYPETVHLAAGSSETIQVVLTPDNTPDQGLIWTSSDRAVAVVDEAGMVSALSAGSCTVTVASKTYSQISCHVQVIVGAVDTREAADSGTSENYVAYVKETNAAAVYPTWYLSEQEVSEMGGEELQFVINQIYAKNGYVFQTDHIQNYFSQMPWYVPVSSDTSRLQMSSVDRSNLNLLVQHRNSQSVQTPSTIGWMWTRHAVDSLLEDSYVRGLSKYDIQLLINTIYAKNGYIFNTESLQAMFEGQTWYTGRTGNTDDLSFSDLDQENLQLLTAYR